MLPQQDSRGTCYLHATQSNWEATSGLSGQESLLLCLQAAAIRTHPGQKTLLLIISSQFKLQSLWMPSGCVCYQINYTYSA